RRRPVATAMLVLMYAATWALIGFSLDYMMGMVMMPSSFLIAAGAVAIAVVYALTPWGRWARDRCRGMVQREPRKARFRDTLVDGARYTAYCIACSAGMMPLLVVVGMSNALVVVAGAAAMLVYKLTPWWRFHFCGTFLRVAPTGCYPAPCSAEPGLSSNAIYFAGGHPSASARQKSTHDGWSSRQGRRPSTAGELAAELLLRYVGVDRHVGQVVSAAVAFTSDMFELDIG